MSPRPVVMIGLDAAEVSLIDQWSASGELPNLAAIRERGAWGALEGNAHLFAGGVWPTFYMSRDVPSHGLYHNKLWRPSAMRCEVPADEWFPAPPFWERLDPALRTAIVDVPMTVARPRPLNGLHLAGWSTHDVVARGSWPAYLWTELQHEFGAPAMPAELFGAQSAATLERLRSQLLRATAQTGRLAEKLLKRERWDLFIATFGALHRGGHYLWDQSQIDGGPPELGGALRELYAAVDRALGQVLTAAPSDARIMVFALHGMGPNSTWADRCTEMLERIQTGAARAPKRGLMYQAKRKLPWPMVRAVTTRLPHSVQNRLVSLWSARMYDWSTTRVFPLPMDHAGYVRINLRGREPQGIVTPGDEYRAVCDSLADAFMSFRDLATGKPIVAQVHRLDDLAPPDADFRDQLPDLVIEWSDVPVTSSPGVVSPRFGEMRWTPTGRLPSGRAGNHRSQGWFMAAGEGIAPGSEAPGHRILDLVPTACQWLGADLQHHFAGRPISELTDRPRGTP